MSPRLVRCCALLLVLGAVTPSLTRGGLPLGSCLNCCGGCHLPQPQCTCTTFQPVVETCLRPKRVTTWRDVCETGYRRQARVETVPVVTYQSRIRYEMVPFRYTRRVPQCSTVMVPERRIRYVPRQHRVSPQPCVSPVLPATPRPHLHGHIGRTLPAAPAPFDDGTPVAADDFDRIGGDWSDVPVRKVTRRRRRRSSRKRFVGAPSAALVWQTPGHRD